MYGQKIIDAGEKLVSGAVQRFDQATRGVVEDRRELAAMIGSMRGQRRQWKWLGWTAAGALLLGVSSSPMMARILPFGWNVEIAAFLMKDNRWNAGGALMEAQDPQGWRILTEAAALSHDNQKALAVGREAAVRTKKEQRCTVIVPAT